MATDLPIWWPGRLIDWLFWMMMAWVCVEIGLELGWIVDNI